MVNREKKIEFFDQIAGRWDKETQAEKEKRIKQILADYQIQLNGVIVDLGCGTGILTSVLTKMVSSQSKIISIDISRKMLVQARNKPSHSKVKYVLADAIDLPLCSNSCNAVVCFCSFPHFCDKVKVLREIRRVLKQSGQLLILHLAGSREINAKHRQIGGAVGQDFLPPAEALAQQVKALELVVRQAIDNPEIYFLWAEKA